jgi:hypothetical protein
MNYLLSHFSPDGYVQMIEQSALAVDSRTVAVPEDIVESMVIAGGFGRLSQQFGEARKKNAISS